MTKLSHKTSSLKKFIGSTNTKEKKQLEKEEPASNYVTRLKGEEAKTRGTETSNS